MSEIITDAAGKRFEVQPNGRWRPVDLEEPNPNGQRRTSWTASELMAAEFPAPRFAVDGLYPEGLSFMCGAPKLGKSWMALGLSIAVAAGGRALGSIPVEAGEALYLALEDSPRRLQSRLRTLLDDDVPVGLHLETEWPRLDEGGTERLDDWLGQHPEARVVFIDVWPRIRPRATKRTDYYQVDYDAAAPLQGLAISRGIAVVSLFHTRKAEAEDFVETVQGTFGTAAAADTIVVVKRGRGQADATLYVTGRDVEERELALRFAPEAGTWALLGDAAEYGLDETRRELLEAIRMHGALSPKRASEVTSVDHNRAKVTLWRMANDGQLEATSGSYSLRPSVTAVTVGTDAVTARSQGYKGYAGPEGEAETDPEPGWRRVQRETGEEPETDEAIALDLLKRELGATNPQAEFIRLWNDDVYAQAKSLREKEGTMNDKGGTMNEELHRCPGCGEPHSYNVGRCHDCGAYVAIPCESGHYDDCPRAT